MRVRRLDISGFKSFAKKTELFFDAPISAVVGPNGSGKSNVVEAIRFVLGEQSLKSMRGKRGEDLIFNGSRTTSRQNRASVSIIFDNTNRSFNLDFDEVTITREVHRDGAGDYFINGSPVRLRDVIELLGSVHIGASGHHIISQGEADRILNSSIKERRSMIEDALGLKIYQWKITESERKLDKTRENINQVESLRREIAPHIKFLKKQAEKVEQARTLRLELAELYKEYLKREEAYLTRTQDALHGGRKGPEAELAKLAEERARLEEALKAEGGENPRQKELYEKERELRDIKMKREEVSRALGRAEGAIEYESSQKEERRHDDAVIPAEEAENMARITLGEITHALESGDIAFVRSVLARVKERLDAFVTKLVSLKNGGAPSDGGAAKNARIAELEERRQELAEQEATLKKDEDARRGDTEELRRAIADEGQTLRTAERALYEIRAKESTLLAELERIAIHEEQYKYDKGRFEEEVREGVVLVGSPIREYSLVVLPPDAADEPRTAQEDRRRKIERIKIRLEDAGASGGEDVLKEYDDTVARDEFLGRELEDLKQSAESLRALIAELAEKLDVEFRTGIDKINTQFQEFFALMFGGGTAHLMLTKPLKRVRPVSDEILDEDAVPPEEEEEEIGIDISVTLPHKKIRGLEVLSGGERALTSIALLFAISQVNPPPFLVLDETDAALDEANSRKYGDMLENLSRYSQLIVVTHNRETMSRAGILYGVTMGSDAVSKLLSIKFDEAAAIAK